MAEERASPLLQPNTDFRFFPKTPMSDISAQAVASLRSRTGVSILLCKKALEEAGGDEEKAIEILRKTGAAQAAKKAGREQKEGSVFQASKDGKAALVMLNCETDFVARDSGFQELGQKLADTLLASGMDAAQKLADTEVPLAVQKLGENISVGEMKLVEAGVSGVYIHSNGKIGVIVGMSSGSEDTARDIAMHAAAMSPLFVRPSDIPESDVLKEKEIWKEQLAKEGKPADIVEKIMMGKEKKFREENALLTQPFVKDPSKLVQDLLSGADVVDYIRMSIL